MESLTPFVMKLTKLRRRGTIPVLVFRSVRAPCNTGSQQENIQEVGKDGDTNIETSHSWDSLMCLAQSDKMKFQRRTLHKLKNEHNNHSIACLIPISKWHENVIGLCSPELNLDHKTELLWSASHNVLGALLTGRVVC